MNPLDLAAKQTLQKVNDVMAAKQQKFVPSSVETKNMKIEVFTTGGVVFENESYASLQINVKRYPHKNTRGKFRKCKFFAYLLTHLFICF